MDKKDIDTILEQLRKVDEIEARVMEMQAQVKEDLDLIIKLQKKRDENSKH